MDVKPGWLTTEFWFKFLIAVLIFVLQTLVDRAQVAGFPPLVQGAILLVVPIVLAWLAQTYGSDRTAVKVEASRAASAAALSVTSSKLAVAALNAGPTAGG